MNKSLLYVVGAVVGIGGAVAAFSVMGGDVEPSGSHTPTGGGGQTGVATEGLPAVHPVAEVGNLEKRTPPTEVQPQREGHAERRALLDRPISEFALRSEVTLKVLAIEVRATGDEAFADEIMAHVIKARKDRYDESLDGEAFLGRVVGFRDRAGNVEGLPERGVEARELLTELIDEYSD